MLEPSTNNANNEKKTLRYVLPTIITLGNAIGGLLSIYCSFNGLYREAVLWLFFGFFADTFDGPAARYLNATSKFGAELDSMCDVITFGVAPFVLVFALNNFFIFFGFAYVLCAIIRLARFGTIPSPPYRHLGLASPMAAIWVAAIVGWGPPFPSPVPTIIISIITLASAILMVTERHYHKILAAARLKMRIVDWALWLSTGCLLILWWLCGYYFLYIFIVWLVCAGYAIFLGSPFLKWNVCE